MKFVLVGFEFESSNKGCEALSYAVMSLLNSIESFKPLTIVNINIHKSMGEFSKIYPNIKFVNIRMRVKRLSFWKAVKAELKDSDAILDITHGDSFADIYGKKWFAETTLVKTFLVHSKVLFILMPQTYGPFKARWAKVWAKYIIKNADRVYTRDTLSFNYLKELKIKNNVINTLDLAFALPYKKEEKKNDKIRVGLNVSGLLWNDCETKANGFGLSVDYCSYCRQLISELLKNKNYEVILVPHVLCDEREGLEFFENDSKAIRKLFAEFPSCSFPNSFKTALDVKNYIANLDILIAARMHASIAAFSSGVAVIPFAYSRKFEGVYSDLKYPYLVDGKKNGTQDALEKTLSYINNYLELQDSEAFGRERLAELKNKFAEDLELSILKGVI